MSSDPVRYSIEDKIVAMVFSLNCLRVCPPYWSCEGHNLVNGEILRIPQVWFYSKSIIIPKIIGEYIFNLKRNAVISYPWHICLAYADNTLETGVSIEPDMKQIERPDLEVLQKDADLIGRNMVDGLKLIAEEHIRRCESKK